MKNRRKLFSESASVIKPRRKLFSSPESIEELYIVICQDCGFRMESPDSTTKQYCPKCGGKRFNLLNDNIKESVIDEVVEIKQFSTNPRRSLFGKSEEQDVKLFSDDPEDNLEKLLKTFSGKEITESQINSIGLTGQDLIDKGFADIDGDSNYRVFDTAFLQSKLFSKLTISITKEMDLDEIKEGERPNIIDGLSDSIPPKGIMIIKKAHSLGNPMQSMFSEIDQWAKDSGIAQDLRMEFGERMMNLEEFRAMIEGRYPDLLVEDIINMLIRHKIIIVQEDQVRILK